MNKYITLCLSIFLLTNCSNKQETSKNGIQVSEIQEDDEGRKIVGLRLDSVAINTRPRNVLLTKHPHHRITPVYKVNYDKRRKIHFTGSNSFHTNWVDYTEGNNWNHNFMPGFEALYGYNLVNISHYNNDSNTANTLFQTPVLIKTFYYPANSNDTLNFKPVNREYYLVSVYDEDSNKDGFVNSRDLRKLYHFDIEGVKKLQLIPNNYSVMSSEYDQVNDFMYVFAKRDTNQNGLMEAFEPTDIFWVDLADPSHVGIQYKSE